MSALVEYQANPTSLVYLPEQSIDMMAETLKKTRGFYPDKPMRPSLMNKVFSRYKKVFNQNMRFEKIRYVFDYIINDDIGNMVYTITIEFLGTNVKLCILEDLLIFDHFTTPRNFMNDFFQRVIDSNESLEKWNSIKKPITFYDRPPVDVMREKFHEKLFYLAHTTPALSAWEALEALRCLENINYGDNYEWSINTYSNGTKDWGKIDYVISHKGLYGLSFVVEEVETFGFNREFSARKLENTFELIISRMLYNLKSWNKLVLNNERGENYGPISLEDI